MATEPTEITGKVVNGVVVLDQPGRLEDGTKVRVQPLDKNSEARGKDINSLREMLLSHAGGLCLKKGNYSWIGSVQGAVATWSNLSSQKSLGNIAC